jgi:hypothetical protein
VPRDGRTDACVAAMSEDDSKNCTSPNLTAKSSSGNQNQQAVRFHSYLYQLQCTINTLRARCAVITQQSCAACM